MNKKFLQQLGIILSLAAIVATAVPFVATAQQKLLPKLEGEAGSGFGGIIGKITPCICDDIGILLTVVGPFGGDFIISFKSPPKINIGSVIKGGPILGGGDTEKSCGTRIDRGCKDKKSATRIKYIGGMAN